MEAITKQLLVGTSRLGGAAKLEAGEVEALLAQVQPVDQEMRLLLTAGAWAAYGQAGRKPLAAVPLPEPAPETDRPVVSPRAARILEAMFAGEHRDLLPEALERVCAAGLRLPEHLLPKALDCPDEKYRPYIARVLGARGLWLSRFHPAWAWATMTVEAGSETMPADAEEIWDSGQIRLREAVLRQLRRQDPARGREWLAGSWAGEKAENRGRLLAVLEVGLSGEDEAFLETALTNRALRVRAQAAELLVRISGSAFLQRLCERADACVSFKPATAGKITSRLKSLIGRKSSGELVISVPQDVDAAWKQEGIITAPPQGVGPRAWWLSRIIGLVPPAHWQERFNLSPAELLTATIAEEWETAVLKGLTEAATLHDAREWFGPLWDHWMGAAGLRKDESLIGTDRNEPLGPLLARMDPEDANRRVEQLIREERSTPFSWFRGLECLPRPWTPEVGRAYLAHVRDRLKKAPRVSNVEIQTLDLAARALPPECFDEALREWDVPEGNDYTLQYWRSQLEKFTEVVLIRQRFVKEVGSV
ncbi:MAG TPA: DUF5691 domain-containing protein [Phycisphaerae bacterium]|nr:DUF5691 domain-containing protein [Phycisphaerae bacterium]HOL26457.1 DUF5691 domain-containing protein [Phycisphaerae bacterium]HPP20436.1 DUF5691 domain-containing protein [Phycisphaerae bacterium]HPU32843.1 DUF5691 domain-containing protein [Phycisphaerae bacterium]